MAFSRRQAATGAAAWRAPGACVLRIPAYNTVREFEFQCCWTNGYVHVTVTDLTA